eukprot:CAMPEP_0197395326 /NCGR_PEP_ID=MMETSP1165-20131217/6746_1 /TAXON_ID=284809 /ORGANISM="Chrysocystis fragilis, Strain CCMP3189" /LENGTH=231 /DNA_ID=CAMNT_0042921087 /DNA_START=134 /DNA_END=827 /DNA_ORIENTATION=+
MTNGVGARDAELHAKLEEEIRQREEKEAQVLEANLEQAKVALENFEAERQQKIRDTMQKNREKEQLLMEQFATEIESENPWERIVSLVDLQTGMSDENFDVSRMRQVFIQLKNSPPNNNHADADEPPRPSSKRRPTSRHHAPSTTSFFRRASPPARLSLPITPPPPAPIPASGAPLRARLPTRDPALPGGPAAVRRSRGARGLSGRPAADCAHPSALYLFRLPPGLSHLSA